MSYGNQLSEGHFCNNSCGIDTSDGYSRFVRLENVCIFLYANGERYDTFNGFCELETSVAEFSKDCKQIRSWGNANQQQSLYCKDVYENNIRPPQLNSIEEVIIDPYRAPEGYCLISESNMPAGKMIPCAKMPHDWSLKDERCRVYESIAKSKQRQFFSCRDYAQKNGSWQ
uniref:Uncharacterized protein n=1 Tax=Romanomermis culicivorax TaxID=13658 RepID=A0A915I5B9_ROMCU